MPDPAPTTATGKPAPIAALREEFNGAVDPVSLAVFLAAHEDDHRKGVSDLRERAQKRIDAYETETARTESMYALQSELAASGIEYVVGIDEVGRGSVAGPLTVAAVALPVFPRIRGLKDSKQLTPAKREELASEIKAQAVAVGFGHIPPHEIDRCGMSMCIRTAMTRALEDTGLDLDGSIAVLIDGNPVHIHKNERAIVKGDATQACIAAASIVAKFVRDRHMIELDARYPGYDLAHSKGYGSAAHIAGIGLQGLSEIHRASFCTNFPKP